jgi:hypothetical protein
MRVFKPGQKLGVGRRMGDEHIGGVSRVNRDKEQVSTWDVVRAALDNRIRRVEEATARRIETTDESWDLACKRMTGLPRHWGRVRHGVWRRWCS